MAAHVQRERAMNLADIHAPAGRAAFTALTLGLALGLLIVVAVAVAP